MKENTEPNSDHLIYHVFADYEIDANGVIAIA